MGVSKFHLLDSGSGWAYPIQRGKNSTARQPACGGGDGTLGELAAAFGVLPMTGWSHYWLSNRPLAPIRFS